MTSTAEYLASPQAVKDLSALNAQFIENFVRNDVASHDRLLHEKFVYINSRGARIDRASYLRNWAAGFDPETINYWDVRDELITIAGDVALVRATNKEIARSNGRDVASMSAYTDIYLYAGGLWKCLQAQITPVAKEHEPSDDTVISVYIKGVRQLRA